MLRKQRGFTLIELIVIIVIIGILAAVAIPRYIDLTTSAADGTARGILGGLRSANGLLFASRIIGNTAGTYQMTDIVGSAQIQGVATAYDGSVFTMTAGSKSYLFTLSPTTPSAPSTPATIYASTGTW